VHEPSPSKGNCDGPVLSRPAIAQALARWSLRPNPAELFSLTVLNVDPPLLCIEGFLSELECDKLIETQRRDGNECDLYLNYRVNSELEAKTETRRSEEAGKLIDAWDLEFDALTAGDRSGFRTQIDPTCDAFQPIVRKAQALLGLEDRDVVFSEKLWVRPSKRVFCIRDQTAVHYQTGEGVSPHVDGNDATVLIYLSGGTDLSEDPGGATCFPEVGLRVKPKRGMALLYWSKHHLLHYAEKVRVGEKWICQLLIDFRVRSDEPDVDWETGRVRGR
jgi:2OG-Fe(II) oxygenase superfamily